MRVSQQYTRTYSQALQKHFLCRNTDIRHTCHMCAPGACCRHISKPEATRTQATLEQSGTIHIVYVRRLHTSRRHISQIRINATHFIGTPPSTLNGQVRTVVHAVLNRCSDIPRNLYIRCWPAAVASGIAQGSVRATNLNGQPCMTNLEASATTTRSHRWSALG